MLIEVTSKNVGIIPVMPFGSPVNIEDYLNWDCVVIDAAASLGSTLENVEKLKPDHFIVYSLHATKVLGAGEGSIVVCGSEDNAKKLCAWANFGFTEAAIQIFWRLTPKCRKYLLLMLWQPLIKRM